MWGGPPLVSRFIYSMASVDWLNDDVHMLAVSSAPRLCVFGMFDVHSYSRTSVLVQVVYPVNQSVLPLSEVPFVTRGR